MPRQENKDLYDIDPKDLRDPPKELHLTPTEPAQCSLCLDVHQSTDLVRYYVKETRKDLNLIIIPRAQVTKKTGYYICFICNEKIEKYAFNSEKSL